MIRGFYEALLEISLRTGFYDNFYHDYGFFSWNESLEYHTDGSGKILVVPVKQSQEGLTNGVFMYFNDDSDQRITFIERDLIEEKIAENRINDIKADEAFAYRNFLLTDLQQTNQPYGMSTPNMEVLARGGGDEGEEEPDPNPGCEGGSYQYVCAHYPAEGNIDPDAVGNYINQTYGNSAWIRDAYDGFSVDELADMLDDLNDDNPNNDPPIPWDSEGIFEEYVNDRIRLYLYTGFGNSSTGILQAPIVTYATECQYVWVWCWQDPADYSITYGTGSGGSNEPYVEPWTDNYNELRLCEGVYEIQDVGPDNPDMIHLNFEFCEDWMAYLEDYIIPNQPDTYGQAGYTTYEDVIDQWAQFQEFEPELFNVVIGNLEDCSPAANIDDYIFEYYHDLECLGALAVFESTSVVSG